MANQGELHPSDLTDAGMEKYHQAEAVFGAAGFTPDAVGQAIHTIANIRQDFTLGGIASGAFVEHFSNHPANLAAYMAEVDASLNSSNSFSPGPKRQDEIQHVHDMARDKFLQTHVDGVLSDPSGGLHNYFQMNEVTDRGTQVAITLEYERVCTKTAQQILKDIQSSKLKESQIIQRLPLNPSARDLILRMYREMRNPLPNQAVN